MPADPGWIMDHTFLIDAENDDADKMFSRVPMAPHAKSFPVPCNHFSLIAVAGKG